MKSAERPNWRLSGRHPPLDISANITGYDGDKMPSVLATRFARSRGEKLDIATAPTTARQCGNIWCESNGFNRFVVIGPYAPRAFQVDGEGLHYGGMGRENFMASAIFQ